MNQIVQEDLEFIISSPIIDWERFRGKTVLISGANGMLPSYMAMTLLYLNRQRQMNLKVYALVRNEDKAKKVFTDFLADEALSFIVADVTQPIAQEQTTFNYIIHAASQAAPSYYGKDSVGIFAANTIGTLNMLELARKSHSEGFLYFSSGAVYGKAANETTFIHEDNLGVVDALDLRSCYAESKRAGENACVCYACQYGIPTKIIRIFHTFGPKVNLNDGRIFSDFSKNILEHNNLVLRSDGSAKRVFLYVADAVVAYFKVLLDGQSGEAYNIGGNEDNEISMRDLAYKLVSLFPEEKLSVIFDINQNDLTYGKMKTQEQRTLPALDKIHALGWHQQHSIDDCFYRTIMSIRNENSKNLIGGGKLIPLQPSIYEKVA